MKLKLFIFFHLFTVCLYSSSLDSIEIKRIADFGKLWGVINIFHPQMAYGNINGDSLLTVNIRNLLMDPSAGVFRKSVKQILARLNDPYTNIEEREEHNTDPAEIYKGKSLRFVDKKTAYFVPTDILINDLFNNGGFAGLKYYCDTLAAAEKIIIDLRFIGSPDNEYSQYYSGLFMEKLISAIIEEPFGLYSTRHRSYYGYESDNGGGFYHGGWETFNANTIVPSKQFSLKGKEICFVVNSNCSSLSQTIAGASCIKNVKVLFSGEPGKFEMYDYYEMALSDGIKVKIRLSENIFPDGSQKFRADKIIRSKSEDLIIKECVDLLEAESNEEVISHVVQNFFVKPKVNSYRDLLYPPAPIRMFALFKYWNIINYYCPNKNLAANWDSVLTAFVPVFIDAADTLEYHIASAKLISALNDTHGYFGSPFWRNLHSSISGLNFAFIENKTIISAIRDDSLKQELGLNAGDEVIRVDGKDVNLLREEFGALISASNESSRQRDVDRFLLSGVPGSETELTVFQNGAQRNINVKRTESIWSNFSEKEEAKPWKKISEDIGYVNMGALNTYQVDSMFTDLIGSRSISMDIRNYPRGTAWTIISYLSDEPVKNALFTAMVVNTPVEENITKNEFINVLPVDNLKPKFKGRLIILANRETQSQAEFTIMMLQAAYKDVTVIGSQTAGADGDITFIFLPGGINTAFSGLGVKYPDGRNTQGIGIVPDLKILPTTEGIRLGKDEVLERAIEFANTGK